jgi:hypothetical protein
VLNLGGGRVAAPVDGAVAGNDADIGITELPVVKQLGLDLSGNGSVADGGAGPEATCRRTPRLRYGGLAR